METDMQTIYFIGSPNIYYLQEAIQIKHLQEALIVNPYEVNKVADYLHNSLTMSEAEAEVRMISLRNRKKFILLYLGAGLIPVDSG